jgi:hypothetical protein
MSRDSDINALRFTETIPPLALAPLAGLEVLACASPGRIAFRASASEPDAHPLRYNRRGSEGLTARDESEGLK